MDTIPTYNSTRRKVNGTSWLFGLAFSIFGLIAIIIPILTTISDFKDLNANQELFKNGIESVAEVTGWTTHYSDEEDTTPSYNFKYSFFNDYTQEWVSDTTYKSYSGSTATKIKSAGEIEIKYLENGASIEMLALSKSSLVKSNLTLIGLTAGIGSLFLGIGMFFIIKEVKKKRLLSGKTSSKEYTVNFTSIASSSTINGVPYYKVEFAFTDDQGVMVIGKSAEEYSYDEASCYQNMGTFRIKTNGKMYMIIDPPRMVAPNNQQYNFDPNQPQQMNNPQMYNNQAMNNGVDYSQTTNYSQGYNYSQPQNTVNSYNYSNTKYCIHCGAEINREDTICKYCNNPQNINN